MITRTTSSPRSSPVVAVWLEHVARFAQYLGIIKPTPIPLPLPMTRRQQLLMAQDAKRTKERMSRLERVRGIRGHGH